MIGIYGGTFDPVHNGHLRVIQELSRELPFDELRLLPCGEPVHRASPQASGDDRLAMLRLAIAGLPGLAVDESELHRAGPSYMVDTLAAMREEIGDRPLVLVIGWDAFVGLPTWHRWQQLPGLAHLLVVRRPGSDRPPCGEIEALLLRAQVEEAGALEAAAAGSILLHPLDVLNISSTTVRELIAAKQDVGGRLPAAVMAYIKEHNLYLN